MNRFLYAEGNPWSMVDPSGHASYYEGEGCGPGGKYCGSTGSGQKAKTTALKVARTGNPHDHDKHNTPGTPRGTPSQSTPYPCSSSICNLAAPTTATEQSWSDWGSFDWSTVGQSACSTEDPCVPGLVCSFGGCVLTPFSDPVSSGECDSDCQREGATLGAVAVGVVVGIYACASICPVVLAGAGESAAAAKDRILALVQGTGPAGPQVGQTIGSFATKADARASISDLGLSGSQLQQVLSAISRATSSSVISIQQSGSSIIVNVDRVGHDGWQRFQSLVGPNGLTSAIQYAWNEAGELVHVDPKFPP